MIPDSLYEAVRRDAARGVWSRGVDLARAETVSLESEASGEAVLRVATPGAVVMPTVVLHTEDDEWECDCGGRDDPCAHVVAAVIQARRANRGGPRVAATHERAGALRYAFERGPEGLVFERLVVHEGETHPLRTTLAAVALGRVEGPSFAATPADQEAERALGAQRSGRLPRGILYALLRALTRCPDVRLDGEPVRASAEPVGWCARLVDDGPGFRLTVEREPRLSEELGDGIALCQGVMRPLGGSGLSGRELADWLGGQRFGPDDVPRLVGEVLPQLEARMPLRIETARLPATHRVPPRIVVEVSREADALRVLPLMVYGDPPSARVDAGRLVPLGEGPLPLRDAEAERRLERRLGEALGLAPGHAERVEDEAALALAERLAVFGHGGPGEVVRGDAWRDFHRAGPLEARLAIDDDDFTLHFETGKGQRVSAQRVIQAWRSGGSLVPLESGGFAAPPAEWLERHGHRVADLLAARERHGRLPAAALPDLAALCDAEGLPRPPALEALGALVEGFEGLPEPRLPAGFNGTLRDYQLSGVAWLQWLARAGLGALLADDMGLGKTPQTLAAIVSRATGNGDSRAHGPGDPRPRGPGELGARGLGDSRATGGGACLIVAPTSVLPNWQAEAARFRPDLRVCLYHGASRALDADADVVLTSYALLRLDRERLAAEHFAMVVLDEAQAIKNPDSQVARAACALQADFRLALTGTPVENRLEELWSQLEFLNPGLLGTRRDFDERVARPVAAGDSEAIARLRARLRPFVLRRRKSEVARELPPRQDRVLRVALSDEERALYDAVRAASVPAVVAKLRAGGEVMAALEVLLRLRQASCHPALLPGHEADGSSKLELLVDRLTTLVADGHRALVFSQWTSLLDLVAPALVDAELSFARLDGRTRDRGAVLEEFAAPEGPPVLLLSLKAGGTGLNLTAADHVFLLDPWWNPFAEDQAADRAHRIGQTRPVLVHRLVAVDTVEERILELQARKRAVAQSVFGEDGVDGGEGVGGAQLRREDLLALLE